MRPKLFSKITALFQNASTKCLGGYEWLCPWKLDRFQHPQTLCLEEASAKEFAKITDELQDVGFKASFMSGIMMPILHGISDMTYLIVALLGGLCRAGKMTIGNIQAFVQYVFQIGQPIQVLSQLAGTFQSAKSSLERIFEVLDEADELKKFERP